MWWLLGCVTATTPPACDDLCALAAARQETCLEDGGLDWSAMGYTDASDFDASCQTWLWELSLLEADATKQGDASAAGALRGTCIDWMAMLQDDRSTCAEVMELDWNTLPWDDTNTAP